jgi:hypothetical protein
MCHRNGQQVNRNGRRSWVYLAEERYQYLAVVNAVIKLYFIK